MPEFRLSIRIRTIATYSVLQHCDLGPVRNQKMAEYADALIAVWDGESRGTKNMISLAKKLNLKCFIYIIPIINASKNGFLHLC